MIGNVVRTAFLAIVTIAPAAAPPTAPAASPAPDAPALKEIGRVRVTGPLCKALVTSAVRSIEIETENDRKLSAIEATLATVDVDTSDLAKFRGTHDMTKAYVDLRASAVAGSALVKQFRSDAKTVPTDEQRASLASLADALDGALHRQRVLADDVGRFIAYLDAHEPITKDAHDSLVFDAIIADSDLRSPKTLFDRRSSFGPTANVPDPLSTTAKEASRELIERAKPIAGDEDAAAARIEPAFEKC